MGISGGGGLNLSVTISGAMWGARILHKSAHVSFFVFAILLRCARLMQDAGWTLCCALVVHGARFDEKGSKAASVRIPQRVSTAREKLSLCGL